jgi:hypothetical protein
MNQMAAVSAGYTLFAPAAGRHSAPLAALSARLDDPQTAGTTFARSRNCLACARRADLSSPIRACGKHLKIGISV